MLSPNDLSNLYSIISDETKTFESISSNFQKAYSKSDQFKVCITLWYLIKENLLNLVQRLTSFYLFYDIYRQESNPTTPFIPILLESLENSKINAERKLLSDLLDLNFTYSKMTIKDFMENNQNNEEIKLPDIEQLWKNYNTTKEKISKEINDWIRPVIYDNNNGMNNIEKSPENLPLFDLKQLSPEEISYNYFEPNFLTYYPNSNYPFYEDEPMWILPTLKYDFIWDFTMSPLQETLNNLINRPLKNKSLSEEQINYILETIGENPNILKEINYKPECLMNLIEKNDDLATQILLKISNHNGFEDYLTLFLENTWTVNSMKVANKIIQKVEMPEAFITTYLKHIIENYKNEKKKENKTRLARLTAFFITNLLDHEHISIKMIPVQIDEIFSEKTKDEDIQKLQNKINQMKSKENE
jgi:hypothetical protein